MSTPAAATGAAVSAAVVSAGPAVRLVLQRVNSASLLVDNMNRRVSIRDGIVCYVAFFNGATVETGHVEKAVKLVTESKMFSFENPLAAVPAGKGDDDDDEAEDSKKAQKQPQRPKPVSLASDRNLSLLIVPQASIAGKLKNKAVQLHSAANKDEGKALYYAFVQGLRNALLRPDVVARLDENGDDIKPAEENPPVAAAESKAKKASSVTASAAGSGTVKNGTYGNVQSMTIDTFGPMTHVFDIDMS